MALPTIEQIFGTGATFIGGDLTIPASAFVERGIAVPVPEDAITLFSSIVSGAHKNYFKDNTDVAVMAQIEYTSQAPAIRNNQFRTLFNFQCQFYGDYVQPNFNPSSI
jgi:hypothetical protein